MQSAVHIFPVLLRPSGAMLYRLRIETDKPESSPSGVEWPATDPKSLPDWHIGSRVSAVAVFAANHPGFQGHFPGSPILPGFLHLQLAMDIVRLYEPQAELTTILSAKFHQPILPGADIQIDIFLESQNQVKAKLRIGDEPASSMEFQFYTGSAPVPAAVVAHTS